MSDFLFQSTHPAGGWDGCQDAAYKFGDISIHPPRGGVGLGLDFQSAISKLFQSTHPAGGWDAKKGSNWHTKRISIHPPRGGVGLYYEDDSLHCYGFQSTHPAGGWDCFMSNMAILFMNFNPPTPRGGGTGCLWDSWDSRNISIHPPRGGVGQQKCTKISCKLMRK